ncbi:pyridoxal 5'-phosphate synthase glutaminase subunit PdxT [Fastidiosibacter lacustris]|uniref:pyridoxal 5'-phosphate synthase glutaminase subunit PdxT n=1 Tax=Fastidiosibacter lacustris TaxID=2056695 RepID=UPI000E347F9D|nr:pyridoxal 5'-phosphate synthase glutaminase subunit PdxT [Fastidiosibacter lacustris]
MNVGVLALQGAYHAHQKRIQELGIHCILVKTEAALSRVDALILPGGESTTMTYLLQKHDLWAPLAKRVREIPVFATCAGVILLQRFGALNIDIIRNGYGRQLESGIFPLHVAFNGQREKIDGFFIRAPVISAVHDKDIEVLSYYQEKPALIKKHKILAATFHPELCQSSPIHKYFIRLART